MAGGGFGAGAAGAGAGAGAAAPPRPLKRAAAIFCFSLTTFSLAQVCSASVMPLLHRKNEQTRSIAGSAGFGAVFGTGACHILTGYCHALACKNMFEAPAWVLVARAFRGS